MISPETISSVRQRADIVAIVGESVKLTRRGRHHIGLCPFHKEKTPSFHVSMETGRYYCFGCHEKGSVIDFVMKLEGLEFPEAVRALAERVGIDIEESAGDGAVVRASREAKRAKQGLYEITQLAASYFEMQLRKHPSARVAREELARRGLQPETPTDAIADALQAFRVGYAPAGWDGLLTHLRTQGISPASAETLGLIVARKGGGGHYDFFRNRLMFAIADVQGRVVGFSGRVLPDPETGEVDKQTGKYVNSPESPIYKKGDTVFGLFQARQLIRQRELAIVVEGNFDVVSLHARGLNHVVAPLGTAFTEAQARAIRRFAPRATLLFDGDAAGREAVRKSRAACAAAGLDTRVAALPSGLDPDDFVRERGVQALERVIDQARSILEYLIDEVLDESFPKSNPNEQAARVRMVAQLIREETDPTVRSMAEGYADKVAARLDISDAHTLRALGAELRRASKGDVQDRGREVGGVRRGAVGRPTDRGEGLLALEMLGCVIEYPEILDSDEVNAGIGVLEGEIVHAFKLARDVRNVSKSDWEESFLAHLQPSIHDFAAQRLAVPRLEDAAQARSEFLCNAQKLKRLNLAREHAQVVRDIDQAGAQGDVQEENELLLEAVRKQKERLGL
jgi:DNA primase